MSGRSFLAVAVSVCVCTLLAVAALAYDSLLLAVIFAVVMGIFAGTAGLWAG